MAISDGFLNELRARVSIVDVVGRQVTWDRRKSNPARRDFWACCPFHNEKTPSFHVDEGRGIYKCFGCGASGDVIGFAMASENLSFLDAVERLAEEAGMEAPRPDPRAREREQARASLADIHVMAASFYAAALRGPAGREALDYLRARRRLGDSVIEAFGLGYAPAGRRALFEHLTARGVEPAQIVEAGLAIQPDDGGAPYDRFRDRIMFPIEDRRGRVIAFGGRALRADAMAKYLNSPETPLFHKSDVVYNFARARRAAGEAGALIAVEGYMDVIALAQAGIAHAVAPMGTALTESQIAQMWKLAPEVTLCFDGDDAGRRAALRAPERIAAAVKPGLVSRFAFLPDGEDPDDLIARAGPRAFIDALAAARPLADVVWARESDGLDLTIPEREAALEAALDGFIATIADARVRRRYQSDFRWRLSALRRMRNDALWTRRRGGGGGGGGNRKGFDARGEGGLAGAGPAARLVGPPNSRQLPCRAGRLARETAMLAALQFRPETADLLRDDLLRALDDFASAETAARIDRLLAAEAFAEDGGAETIGDDSADARAAAAAARSESELRSEPESRPEPDSEDAEAAAGAEDAEAAADAAAAAAPPACYELRELRRLNADAALVADFMRCWLASAWAEAVKERDIPEALAALEAECSDANAARLVALQRERETAELAARDRDKTIADIMEKLRRAEDAKFDAA